MAKALMGHRVNLDERLVHETMGLRRRIKDLEVLVDRLQRDNDRLRAELVLAQVRRPDVSVVAAPTIRG